MHSEPGMWEHYDGHVDVWAESHEDAIERARDKLKAGTFPERSRGSWKVDRVECING